eukprot:TRINITY_DN3752_c0_g2_i1.p1 TRINITY_DN3752_c0_g2~~TRINITY_DN3752_c0_g2_i1.p1  ORF type:complete len:544 (-),score=81.34 TRINITY_DN3752_c0_g2_i1:323-1954(-)
MEEDRKMITHQVEVNNWNPRVKSMREKLEASQKTHSYPKMPPTIHRVPEHIRKGEESAYQPQIISIGPYHRSEKGLQAMENHKWRYLQDFLSRNKTICLERCLVEIQSLEVGVRNCYSETIDLKSDEFVEVMVLDGCFIIELFLKQNENTESDPIFNTRWMLPVISHDMLLLENQLPFFILKRLFELIETSNRESKSCLEDLAVRFFRKPLFWKIETPHLKEIHHLLHLLHSSLLPDSKQENPSNLSQDASVKLTFRKWKNSSFKHLKHTPSACSASSELSNEALSSPRPPPPASPPKPITYAIDIQGPRENLQKDDPMIRLGAKKWEGLAQLLANFKWKKIVREVLSLRASPPPQPPKSIPGATELHGAGVKFKTRKEAESFLEVKFTDGVMLIPHLLIDCNTNSLFRNFIAFEQCYPKSKTHFTSYAFFMDCIVNTARDVALLGQQKIIEHWLGNDGDVALLFNRLCCGVAIDTQNSYLSDLFNEVTEYCKTSWHTWRACLMRDYFSNPWAIVSVVAAVVLLLIGIVQTFLAFISYLRPTS